MSRISRDIEAFFPRRDPGDKEAGMRLAGTLAPPVIDLIGWMPLLVLAVIPLIFRNAMAPWMLMWALAFALYFGCKWLTWWKCRILPAPWWRHLGYLIAWPGMDAKAFLDPHAQVPKPASQDWIAAVLKTIFGAFVVWRVVRLIPASLPLVQGWVGLVGLIFVLHFGTFHIVALAWQQAGVNAQPIMQAPILSTSLAEFWEKRWNSAFNLLVHDLVFRQLFRLVGAMGAMMAVFLVSGLIHDLVISVPARGGYGLPTAYFLAQGLGLRLERSKLGRKWGLGAGATGRCFTIAVTALPAIGLFHPPFIRNVILPMLQVIGAT